MWFDDFILQFSLPILVRAHRRSPLIRWLRRSFALLNRMEWSLPAAAASIGCVLYNAYNTACAGQVSGPCRAFQSVARLHCVATCASAQCALVNWLQWLFSKALLDCHFSGVRILRICIGAPATLEVNRSLQVRAQMWAACWVSIAQCLCRVSETWERAGARQGIKDLKARIVMKVTTYVSMGLTTNPPHDLVPPSRNSEFAHVIRCVHERGGADFVLRVCSVFGTREILRLGVLLHRAVPRQIGE